MMVLHVRETSTGCDCAYAANVVKLKILLANLYTY